MPKRIVLINYDNGSRWPVLPQNLILLASGLARDSHKVQIVDFNLTCAPYELMADKLRTADIVGLGFVAGYYPHREAKKIAAEINKSSQRGDFKFIIGGHGPSASPEYYEALLNADAVFTGSADFSLRQWIRDGEPSGIIPSMGFDPNIITYRAYPQGPHMDVYKRIMFPNTKSDQFAIQLLSGRGCPYSCSFCYRADKKSMHYEIHYILEQIRLLYQDQRITHFQFSDELFMSDPAFIHTMSEALIHAQEKLGIKLNFDCNGRLNQATPANLDIMQKAGFRYINYGCEAVDDVVLEEMNKKQTVEDIHRGIEATVKVGISPGLNFMWGNPGDSFETLEKAMEFILTYTDYCELRTIRPVTPYPGSPLFYDLIQEGRLDTEDPVGDFYDYHHVNSDLFTFNWMDIPNKAADKALGHVNATIANDYYEHKAKAMERKAWDFYHHITDPIKFRGWREI